MVQYDPREGRGGQGVVDRDPDAERRNVGAAGPAGTGSLIAVSYEARARGIKRGMRGSEARKACPELELVQVPTRAGKSNMQVYRDAGSRVVECLRRHCPGAALEKASVDESYVDLTEAARGLLAEQGPEGVLRGAAGTHVAGWDPGADAGVGGGGAGGGEESESEEPSREERDGASGAERGGEGALPGRASVRRGAAPTGAAPAAALASFLRRDGGVGSPLRFCGGGGGGATLDGGELLLAAGCALAARLRAHVRQELGYSCSAGISGNKLLAKLGSGLHKPNQQTALFPSAVPALLRELPVDRLRGLGGKLGERVKALGIATAGELAEYGGSRLRREFGERTGAWLHALANGDDGDEVKDRADNLSLSNGKRFDPQTQLRSLEQVESWLRSLLSEVAQRAEAERDNKGRAPRTLTVSISSEFETNATGASSRSCAFRFGVDNLLADALRLVKGWAEGLPPGADGPGGLSIKSLFVAASNFHDAPAAPPEWGGLDKFLRRRSPRNAVRAGGAGGGGGGGAPPPAGSGGAGGEGAPSPARAVDPGRLDRLFQNRPPPARYLRYEVSELDEAVLSELPEDIRREVLLAAGAPGGRDGSGSGSGVGGASAARRGGGGKRKAENCGPGIRGFFPSKKGQEKG